MSDLLDRILFLKRQGENQPSERFDQWLKNTEIIQANEFLVNGRKYYWKIISSIEFKDIIDEDETDWFLIYSDNEDFKAIGKKRARALTNLIGTNDHFGISTLWILKSNIESIEVNEISLLIWSPHLFDSKLAYIDYDFKQLIIKLRNPKIKLTEFITQPKSKTHTRRLR